ncbi:hypothetical protein BDB01DRAFT_883628 [Pilobolus umbonatus]|nr:hypothetical protein BDB01DRAFT_883628 [Pilobolus umbonatus]
MGIQSVEIVKIAVPYLSPNDMYECLTVNRVWSKVFRQILYRKVVITRSDELQKFIDALEYYPECKLSATYTKELDISCNFYNNTNQMSKTISTCINLEILSLPFMLDSFDALLRLRTSCTKKKSIRKIKLYRIYSDGYISKGITDFFYKSYSTTLSISFPQKALGMHCLNTLLYFIPELPGLTTLYIDASNTDDVCYMPVFKRIMEHIDQKYIENPYTDEELSLSIPTHFPYLKNELVNKLDISAKKISRDEIIYIISSFSELYKISIAIKSVPDRKSELLDYLLLSLKDIDRLTLKYMTDSEIIDKKIIYLLEELSEEYTIESVKGHHTHNTFSLDIDNASDVYTYRVILEIETTCPYPGQDIEYVNDIGIYLNELHIDYSNNPKNSILLNSMRPTVDISLLNTVCPNLIKLKVTKGTVSTSTEAIQKNINITTLEFVNCVIDDTINTFGDMYPCLNKLMLEIIFYTPSRTVDEKCTAKVLEGYNTLKEPQLLQMGKVFVVQCHYKKNLCLWYYCKNSRKTIYSKGYKLIQKLKSVDSKTFITLNSKHLKTVVIKEQINVWYQN